jgi:hypothetical protein
MGDSGSRTPLRICLVLLLLLLCGGAVARAGGWFADPVAALVPAAAAATDDAGDGTATASYDGPAVRRRAAIAIHPAPGADRAHITAELRAAARTTGVGELEPATFAVFSAQMLEYLVPEMTFVAAEDVPVAATEAMMRDHQPRDVAFYLVQPVLVHDLTFAVIPGDGVSPDQVRARVDREGILTDSLGRYTATTQRTGVTVRYFGALLSDGRIEAVRDAMGRAAGVPADRVEVSPSRSGPGVDLSGGVPRLTDDESTRHHH